jgi:phosphohistidine phosphatase
VFLLATVGTQSSRDTGSAKTLFLLRHAKSSWDDPTLVDYDRPLAPRGRRAAARIAAHVGRQGISPALVLCSPAQRTRETLAAIAPELGAHEVAFEEGLYGAEAFELLDRLRAVSESVPSVLLVGHNPGLHELALFLAEPSGEVGRVAEKFPTGALATLAVDGAWSELDEGGARLLEYVVPRELG